MHEESSSYRDKIWGADLQDMQLISEYNNGVRLLLCVIDIYSKHAQVVPLKGRESITITNAFQKILDESDRKPSKTWVDKGGGFYSRSMKSLLHELSKNLQMVLKMCPTRMEGKPVVTE